MSKKKKTYLQSVTTGGLFDLPGILFLRGQIQTVSRCRPPGDLRRYPLNLAASAWTSYSLVDVKQRLRKSSLNSGPVQEPQGC